MVLSFREIARDDKDLMKLLEIARNHEVFNSEAINVSDIKTICAKITTVNTTDSNPHHRRIVWTVTGSLLIGLTIFFDFQVQICLAESQRLKESCIRHSFVVERTKTTKRKIKHVTTSKNKRKRTVEIEYEEETVERQRFWEEPLELDRNFEIPRDSCLVPADQITIREVNEPSIDDSFEEVDMTFGDEGHALQFDDDDEMLDDETSGMIYNQPPEPQPVRDENMNHIVVPNVDQGYISFEADALQPLPVEPQRTDQMVADTSSNLLSQLAPLQPSQIDTSKKSKKKRRGTIFMDEEKMVPAEIMHRRISNTFVGCKKRLSVSIQKKQPLQTLKKKPIDLFAVPAMDGEMNRELFEAHAIIKPVETDWTIIQDAFERDTRETSIFNNNDNNDNEHHSQVSMEVDILRNESQSQRQLRSSLNVEGPPVTRQLRSSTPCRPIARNSFRCSTPLHANSNAHSPNHIISPPPHLQQWNSGSEINPSNPLAPPVGFDDNDQSNLELQATEHQQVQQPNQQNATELDISAIELEERPGFITLLDKNSLEYVVISKLMVLWEKEIHPIKVEHLLTPRSNRIQAAKTFSSLLILKKKKLVQLENSDDGKIIHISMGDELKLDGN